jgi:anti-anti-sigma regulatory factor
MHESQGFTIWSLGGLPLVTTPEEIDLSNADQLLHALLVATADTAIVIVDMTATTFCDASTVDTLEWVNQRLHDDGGELRVIPATPVPAALEITRPDQTFRIFGSLPGALVTTPSCSQPYGQIHPVRFAHPVATWGHPDQVSTCAWCQVTAGAPWGQREREHDRAFRSHQACKAMVTENCQADNIVYVFGRATGFHHSAHGCYPEQAAA